MARKAALPQVVYADRASPAHVIPAGMGTDAGPNAMRELVRIAGTLARQYEFVVFDCGFAGPEGLEHIADAETIILVNAHGATRAETEQTEAALRAAGYDDAVTVRAQRGSAKRQAWPGGAAAASARTIWRGRGEDG